MRKIGMSILISALAMTQPAYSANSLSGKSCKPLGATSKVGTITYKCIKSGRNFIWDKGTKISSLKAPTHTPTLAPSPAPKPSQAPELVPKLNQECFKNYQVSPEGFLTCTLLNGKLTWQTNTFQNLVNDWKISQEYKNSKLLSKPVFDVRYSPFVNRKIADAILASLINTSQFWQDQYLPTEPLPVLFFNETEKSWFELQMKMLKLNTECIAQQLTQFDDEISRNGSNANMAGFAGCNNVFFFDFYIGTARSKIGVNELRVGAHEYTHSGQFGSLGEGFDFAPCWLIEGGAEFYGITLGARDQKDILELRQDHVWGGFYLDNTNLASKTIETLPQFIEENGNNYNHQICGPNGAYPVGAIATEYLFNLKGQQGILDLFDGIKRSHDYKASIQKVYGIPWEEMKVKMAEYIQLVVAQTPRP